MKNFDELLDGVLREDVAAEPRTGLEGRVMARVRTDGLRRSVWRFAAWGAVAAALPVCIVALLVWPKNVPVQRIAEVPAVSASASPEKVAVEPVRNQRPRVMQERVSVRQQSAIVAHAANSLPKLDVFPSPAPIDVFPRPVAAIGGIDESTVMALRPREAGLALAALQQEQKEPIRIASIEIAPLQTDIDTGPNQ